MKGEMRTIHVNVEERNLFFAGNMKFLQENLFEYLRLLSQEVDIFNVNVEERNLFFTSDSHFSHKNILKYCNRPFKTIEQMNSALIKNWNSVVGKNDIIIHLGDFCFGSVQTWTYLLSNLNGEKYLVNGNHDRSIPKHLFTKVTPYMNLMVEGDEEIDDGQRISVCHYPMLSWYQSHRGAWQLYGHVHGGLSNKGDVRTTPNQLDVGVDVHDFTPISYEQVKTIITKQNLK